MVKCLYTFDHVVHVVKLKKKSDRYITCIVFSNKQKLKQIKSNIISAFIKLAEFLLF